ncbi:MAG: peptidoglycan editing factor PgeF [Anaerolineae bacterium]|nr:peptidoglycan editing factor PgeF [Anaerolineae bacterium]
MRREIVDGVVLYRFEGLSNARHLTQAVFTRLGGASKGPFAELNLGHTVGDDLGAVEENHRRSLGTLGLSVRDVVTSSPVHGARVGVVGQAHLGTAEADTDALVSNEPDVALLFRFADCVPVAFYDPDRRVVGVAHAGWRGVVAGVVEATVHTMVDRFGSDPRHMWAGVGPAIGPCCFEVGPDVAELISQSCPRGSDLVKHHNGRITVDLPGAVGAQLSAAGLRNVEQSGLCTACRVDEFFSHRAENGKTGRFGMVLGLTS